MYGPHEQPGRLVSSLARALLRGEPAPDVRGDAAPRLPARARRRRTRSSRCSTRTSRERSTSAPARPCPCATSSPRSPPPPGDPSSCSGARCRSGPGTRRCWRPTSQRLRDEVGWQPGRAARGGHRAHGGVVEGERLAGDRAAPGGHDECSRRRRPTVAAETEVLDAPAAGGAAIRGGALRLAGYGGGRRPRARLRAAADPAPRRRRLRPLHARALADRDGAGPHGRGLTAVGLREYSVLGQAERRRDDAATCSACASLLTGAGVATRGRLRADRGIRLDRRARHAVAGVGLLLLVAVQPPLDPASATNLRFGWITAAELARQAVATVLIIVLVVAGRGSCRCWPCRSPPGSWRSRSSSCWSAGASPCGPTFEPERLVGAGAGRRCPMRSRSRSRDLLPDHDRADVARVDRRGDRVLRDLLPDDRGARRRAAAARERALPRAGARGATTTPAGCAMRRSGRWT